jgi:predicted DNA-binding transcriptional regulator AlpA
MQKSFKDDNPFGEVAPRLRDSVSRIFVSDATLAGLLDTSRSTIHRYVKKGILPPPIKIGGLTRFDLEEAIARIRDQTGSGA